MQKIQKTHTQTYALRFVACLLCLKTGHAMTCQRQANPGRIYLPDFATSAFFALR